MEETIVHDALENLHRLTGIQAEWKPDNRAKAPLDGRLELKLAGKMLVMEAEVKREIRNTHLTKFFQLKKDYPNLILIAGKIYPRLKEELRKNEIAYLEAGGNFFLKNKDHQFLIEGQKAEPAIEEVKNRAFNKAGLKLVFHFLNDENFLNATHRTIANTYGIALGNVNYIIQSLKQQGFVLQVRKNTLALANKEELLQKWIAAYEAKLKPALHIGTFRFLKQDDFPKWKELQFKNKDTFWGGEPAGELLTKYLKPAELTIYTNEGMTEISRNYKLVPDKTGNVKTYKKFWMFNEEEHTAPPLLVYADLMSTGDRRCIETAQKIYDGFLKGKF